MKYTIGVLVTNWSEYEEMKRTFIDKGFKENDCEYLTVDNTNGNTMCAYSGNNKILNDAKGDYVILCHQDIRIAYDSRGILDAKLKQLDRIDPNWALAGNAGGVALNELAIRITDPFGYNQHRGNFPAKVMSLDGNFMIVKNSTRLAFSNDLSGFHFYDADICINASIRGYNVYVVDFHLQHLGAGKIDDSFYKMKQSFSEKWKRVLNHRVIQMTHSQVEI